jgi:hypothetical protein
MMANQPAWESYIFKERPGGAATNWFIITIFKKINYETLLPVDRLFVFSSFFLVPIGAAG